MDNDSDGLIDFPADPGCTSATDNNEYNAPQLPVIVTNNPLSVSSTSAILSGTITAPNGTVTRSFKWGTTSLSNILSITGTQSTPGSFSGSLLGLSAGTQYRYQACGTNIAGQACGVTIFFTTPGAPPATLPIVTTNVATSIGNNSATLNAFVNLNGSPSVTRSFKWGIGTPSNTLSLPGSQTFNGSFSSVLSSLSPVTTYVFQACVQGLAGPTCGSILSFTTTGPAITYQCSDSIDNDGDGLIDFPSDPGCASPTDNSELNFTPTYQCSDGADNDGDGLTDFPSDPGCSSTFDNDEFNTVPNPGNPPVVNTNNASNIGNTSATLNGFASFSTPSVSRWFEYGTTFSNLNLSTSSFSLFSPGNFSQGISGLSTNTTYWFRACASNSYGQDCGSTNSFETGPTSSNDEPEVDTLSATNIDTDSATLRGDVDTNGLPTVRWFEWSEDDDDLDETIYVTGNSSSSGTFSRTLNGLDEDTEYFYRACASNSEGEDCGETLDFDTDDENGNGNLNATTLSATGITSTSATLRGEVENDTNENADVFFKWGYSTSLPYTRDAGDINEGDTDTFSETLTGLTPNTIYYFRIVAQDGDEDSGSILSFQTLPTAPTYTYTPPVTTTNTIYVPTTTTVVSSSSIMSLSITPDFESLRQGDNVTFTVKWKNLSAKTVNNATLKITMPEELVFDRSTSGTFSSTSNALIDDLGSLAGKEEGEMRLSLTLKGGEKNDTLITEAKLVFDQPTTGAKDEVTAYATNIISEGGSVLGALALFGEDGFLPKTLVGWGVLAAAITGIVLLGRKLYTERKILEAKPQ